MAAHPEHAEAIHKWIDVFLADPFDETLDRWPFLDQQGRDVPNTYHYWINGVPIPLVITIEERRRVSPYRVDPELGTIVEVPQVDPDDVIEGDYGYYARIVWPRRATDELPSG